MLDHPVHEQIPSEVQIVTGKHHIICVSGIDQILLIKFFSFPDLPHRLAVL